MPLVRRLAAAAMPQRSHLAFRIAPKNANLYNNENDFDMRTNGELHLARLLLPHAGTVFDVGANRGKWSEAALAINPRAEVHAFEPSPATYAMLVERLGGRVVANNTALGNRVEQRPLFVYADGCDTNSLYQRVGVGDSQRAQESVAIRTLDDYCDERGVGRVHFLKIDVEEHEPVALQGARRLLSVGRIGAAQFEYGGSYIDARVLLKDIWELIQSLNADYSFFKIFPRELRRIDQYEQMLETFQYSNWVVIHRQWLDRC